LVIVLLLFIFIIFLSYAARRGLFSLGAIFLFVLGCIYQFHCVMQIATNGSAGTTAIMPHRLASLGLLWDVNRRSEFLLRLASSFVNTTKTLNPTG
jgi:hypothetical protein